MSHVLVLKENGVVFHVGPDAQDVLHLFMFVSDRNEWSVGKRDGCTKTYLPVQVIFAHKGVDRRMKPC